MSIILLGYQRGCPSKEEIAQSAKLVFNSMGVISQQLPVWMPCGFLSMKCLTLKMQRIASQLGYTECLYKKLISYNTM